MKSDAFEVTQQTVADSRAVADKRQAWKKDYDFQSKYLSLGSVQMHYVDQCAAAEPVAPILMVHGNPTWSFLYRRQIEQFSHRYRTIAVDHVGCGLSDKPVDYSYCLETHIANLCALIDELNLEKIVLMAHDWGGAIGLGALLKRRERFKSIVLFNTGAFPPPYIPLRIRACRWPLIGKVGVQGFNMFAKAAITMATEQPGGLPSEIAEGFLAPYDTWANRMAIYQFVKDIPLSERHPTWSVLSEIEKGLDSLSDWPIQLIWGMKDWCFRPECLRRFQQHWPQARVKEIGTAGHYVLEDAPDQVLDIVNQFLQETAPL